MTALARAEDLARRAPGQAAVLDRMSGENFPVALRLLGGSARRALVAVYGFARLVDELGDEAEGDRSELLDWVEHELELALAGGRPEHPVMRSLAEVLASRRLPEDPLRRLIQANRRDQTVTRYRTFEELLGYCQLSAAPVGELVLHVFGVATTERVALSDWICAGLQLVEHLQDVGEDYRRGRIYMPAQDMARFGCRPAELGAPTASDSVRALIAFEVERARALLAAGAPLVRLLPGVRPRLAVAAYLAGGRAALHAIERKGYDTLRSKARVHRRSLVVEWVKGVSGR
jgi:squalene synthase HpnC